MHATHTQLADSAHPHTQLADSAHPHTDNTHHIHTRQDSSCRFDGFPAFALLRMLSGIISIKDTLLKIISIEDALWHHQQCFFMKIISIKDIVWHHQSIKDTLWHYQH